MTEYYGSKEEKRLQRLIGFDISDINDTSNPVGFIKSKGMDLFMEYVTSHNYWGHLLSYSTLKHINGRLNRLVTDDRWKNLEEVTYKGEKYYMGEEEMTDQGLDSEIYYIIYKEIPKIREDDTFKWRDNVKYGVKETTIKSGSFEYHIIVRANDEAYIQVQYTKCENRHRTKVTIADLTVYNVSNEAIKEAINEWKSEFKSDMEDVK